jgi:transposase
MTRRYGRAPLGKRLVASVPHGHWKTSTFVAGLRTTGLTAPLVVDGAMNGDIFRTYVEQVLAPTLVPSDIVILDNLGSHKVAGVHEAIEARGASLVYLPPYSPDLNPIEQAFAKLKALLRKIAARTISALWDAPRRHSRPLHVPRMLQLSRQRWICSSQTEYALEPRFSHGSYDQQ